MPTEKFSQQNRHAAQRSASLISVRRFARTFAEIAPGDMIYGLMRADALEKAGVLPWHLVPDRLTLMLLYFLWPYPKRSRISVVSTLSRFGLIEASNESILL